MDTLERALELEPDHLSLYALTLDDPDAEGLTGPDGDHLPTTARRPPLARRRDPGAGRGSRGRPVPPRRPSPGRATAGAATRSATGRGPGHESRHNLAYWERRPYEAVGPGRPRVRRRDAPLERRPPRALHRGADAARRRPARRACRPAAPRRSTRRPRRAEAVVLGLRTDRGLPRSAATEPPLADVFGWALAAELLTIDEADRIVLTTRGRLLSNELFARLV